MNNYEEVFESLGLNYLIEVFHDNNIDDEAFLLLGEEDLKELVPKIGPRLKIKKYINSLKDQTQLKEALTTGEEATLSESSKETAKDLATTEESESVDSFDESPNSGSIDGRAILKEGQSSQGLLKEGSRRKLSQLVINNTIDKKPSSKITSEEFIQLASEIVKIFPKESIVVYYSAYLAGKADIAKKNASGKLYESYITRRRKLRQSGELPGTSRASSTSTTNYTTPSVSSEDNEVDEEITWLKNNVEPWKSVEEKWRESSDYRLKRIYNTSSISEYFTNYPALKQPQGYTLLLNDFNWLYPGKENKLFSTLQLKQEDILACAKKKAECTRDRKLKTAITNLTELIDEHNPETSMNVCLMLISYIINISPARKRKGKQALKFSRAEICDGFIRQVSSEANVTTAIIEKREQIVKQERTLQPYVIFVGNSVSEVKAAYVVINDTVYHFNKLITAVDSVFKIFQSTGACYPEECEDIWLFIQLGFYNITTKFDRHSQVVNSLLTDLGLICDKKNSGSEFTLD